MIERVKKWWHGEDIVRENDPNSPIMFIGWSNKKHWSSKIAHWLISLFTNPERRSIFLAILGFITFVLMLVKYFTNTNT